MAFRATVLHLLSLPSTHNLVLGASTSFLLFLRFLSWSRLLHPYLRLLLGILFGVASVYLWSVLQKHRGRIRKQHVAYTHDMTSLNHADLFRLLPREVANSAKAKRVDELHWLNLEIAKAWPYLDKAISDLLKEKLQPILHNYKMGLLASITVSSLSLGVESPRLHARADLFDATNVPGSDWTLTAGVKLEDGSINEVTLQTGFDWKPAKEKIMFEVKTIGPDFKVKVHNVRISGTMKFVFKPLTETLPGFGAVLLSFTEIPETDFDLKITEGDINGLPGVDKMIDSCIRTAIEDALVWPNRIVHPILPGDYSFLELRPVGILDVSILEATDVMNTDILGKSDCFTILYVRKKPERIKRSSTKKNTLHPVWNEGFRIEVDDAQYQVLTVQLMDEESFSKSTYIGRATVPLKDLRAHEAKEMWLDMVVKPSSGVKSTKPRARLHLILIYEPFEDDKTGVLRPTQEICNDGERDAQNESSGGKTDAPNESNGGKRDTRNESNGERLEEEVVHKGSEDQTGKRG